MSKERRVDNYWHAFLATLPEDSPYRDTTYVAEQWGDGPELANTLGGLIKAGIKTACCSTVWEYEESGEELPQVGLITVVLDGNEAPLCIIETTEVTITAYNKVDAQFAFDEGEGDRTLAYWRECHWEYFTFVLESIKRKPTEDMPLICERFRLLYAE